MEPSDKVLTIEEAQEHLFEAIELLEQACAEDKNAQAYVLDHLKILAGSGHGFMSSDLNLDDLKYRYSGKEVEDE
jgi:hypothetical protein